MTLDARIVRTLGIVPPRRRPDHQERRDGGRARPERLRQEHAVPLPRRAAADRRRDASSSTVNRSTTRPPTSSSSPSDDPSPSSSRTTCCSPTCRRWRTSPSGCAPATSQSPRPVLARRRWLERVGLADHAHHRPRALSGGQAQRVALARALATEPRLLLLDEPLAALDAGTRGDVRRDLRRHLATFDGVRLLVTHDPVDAYALADRVVILERGSVVQTGTLADVAAHPRSRYIADLVGVNLLRGTGDDGSDHHRTGGTHHPGRANSRGGLCPHPTPLRRPLHHGSRGQPAQRVGRHRRRRRPPSRPRPRPPHGSRSRSSPRSHRPPSTSSPCNPATGSGPRSKPPTSPPTPHEGGVICASCSRTRRTATADRGRIRPLGGAAATGGTDRLVSHHGDPTRHSVRADRETWPRRVKHRVELTPCWLGVGHWRRGHLGDYVKLALRRRRPLAATVAHAACRTAAVVVL